MVSNAGWQTTASSGGHDDTTDERWSELHWEAPGSPSLKSSMDTLLSEPMDQRSVESLLRRLVDRVEET
jgi:hypothetical protein